MTGKKRGRGSDSYQKSYQASVQIGDELKDAILLLILTNHRQGVCVTANQLCAWALCERGIIYSRRQMCKILLQIGCKYRKVNEQFVRNKVFQNERIAKFIYKYHHALIAQEKGEAIIVYTDESYCHNNHALKYSWFGPAELDREVFAETRSGRFIIFHAITKDGLLNNNLENAGDDLTKPVISAEYIYQHSIPKAKKRTGPVEIASTKKSSEKDEYHGNINWEMFWGWITNRLIPAFEHRYPGKKMILMMDNASYHNKTVHDYKCASDLKKPELLELLAEHKYKIKSPKKCNQSELQLVWSQHVKDRPWLKQTVLQQLFDNKKWELLMTPPSCPRTQPIELVWGMVKDRVARQYTGKRNMSETINDIYHAFYDHRYKPECKQAQKFHRPCHCEIPPNKNSTLEGADFLFSVTQPAKENPTPRGLTAEHCQRMIKKCEDWMRRWIAEGNKSPLLPVNVKANVNKFSENWIIDGDKLKAARVAANKLKKLNQSSVSTAVNVSAVDHEAATEETYLIAGELGVDLRMSDTLFPPTTDEEKINKTVYANDTGEDIAYRTRISNDEAAAILSQDLVFKSKPTDIDDPDDDDESEDEVEFVDENESEDEDEDGDDVVVVPAYFPQPINPQPNIIQPITKQYLLSLFHGR